jgi:hypothetical protein
MGLHTGKIVDGAIRLGNLGIGDPNAPVHVTDEELELIRAGQSAARRGELLDARAFLRELRRLGSW